MNARSLGSTPTPLALPQDSPHPSGLPSSLATQLVQLLRRDVSGLNAFLRTFTVEHYEKENSEPNLSAPPPKKTNPLRPEVSRSYIHPLASWEDPVLRWVREALDLEEMGVQNAAEKAHLINPTGSAGATLSSPNDPRMVLLQGGQNAFGRPSAAHSAPHPMHGASSFPSFGQFSPKNNTLSFASMPQEPLPPTHRLEIPIFAPNHAKREETPVGRWLVRAQIRARTSLPPSTPHKNPNSIKSGRSRSVERRAHPPKGERQHGSFSSSRTTPTGSRRHPSESGRPSKTTGSTSFYGPSGAGSSPVPGKEEYILTHAQLIPQEQIASLYSLTVARINPNEAALTSRFATRRGWTLQRSPLNTPSEDITHHWEKGEEAGMPQHHAHSGTAQHTTDNGHSPTTYRRRSSSEYAMGKNPSDAPTGLVVLWVHLSYALDLSGSYRRAIYEQQQRRRGHQPPPTGTTKEMMNASATLSAPGTPPWPAYLSQPHPQYDPPPSETPSPICTLTTYPRRVSTTHASASPSSRSFRSFFPFPFPFPNPTHLRGIAI